MSTTTDTDRPRRSKFDRWLWDNDISNALAGEKLGCAGETVRRYRLPFGAQGRRIPDQAMLARIHGLTGGEITPSDFYPEALNCGPAASPEERR